MVASYWSAEFAAAAHHDPQRQREAEQKQLARTVIEKVMASLKDEKTQKQILENAVADVESLVKSKAV